MGDIHGRLDLLEAALAAIERHAHGVSARTVFLGDYVDRGPDSRAVVERLMSLQADGGVVCLKGNHEALMVQAFTDGRRGDFARWRAYGSGPTLRSYGVAEAIEAPADQVPRDHIRWMAGLPLTTADPQRVYVHAGLSPRKPLHAQDASSLLWIREKFLQAAPREFGMHVVHGHTPQWDGKPDPAEPELLAHRTNLDTGAFATGVLTVAVFERDAPGGPTEVLAIRGGPPAPT